MKNQKIITLALGLLIIAGIIVVALKGFNVDFMLKQHDSIEYSMDSEFEISDVEKITSEVLKDKKFKVRIIELFNDAISINAETITTEEAEQITKTLRANIFYFERIYDILITIMNIMGGEVWIRKKLKKI